MKLFEHEAKRILSERGIPTPRGELAGDKREAGEIAFRLRVPVAVKAQILVASRKKAGGVLFAKSPQEAEIAAEKLLGANIGGTKVQNILVEEMVSSKQELYVSVSVDRSQRAYLVMASTSGGIDVEEMASTMPYRIVKMLADPLGGFHGYQARQIAKKLGYGGSEMLNLGEIVLRLYDTAVENDAELLEINPLIETSEGRFVAADAHFIVDDSSLFRHFEFKRPLEKEKLSAQEREAAERGLAYVQLEGNIGVVGNGAGLVMATLDMIDLYGGRPANFLDVGGGAASETMMTALNIVFFDSRVSVVFINILGGITRCDEIARGILEAKKQSGFSKPLVVRLVGTNEEEGKRLLLDAGIHVLMSMESAAEKSVEIAKRGA